MKKWKNPESFSLATSHALEEEALEPVSSGAKWIIKLLLLMLILFLTWAALFEIEIIASGNGKIVPISTVQRLQSLESGIISEILVHEGEIVKKGDVLFRLNPAQAKGDVAQVQATREGLMAAIARLQAETEGTQPGYPESLKQSEDGRKVIATEERLRIERAETLNAQISVLQQQKAQKVSEAEDFRGRLPQTKKSLELVKEQLRLVKPLEKMGAVSPTELIQLSKEEANLQSQLVSITQGQVTAEAQMGESDARIRGMLNQFRSEAREDMTKRQVLLNSLEGGLAAKEDVLVRTEIRSPVNGIIKILYVTTVGGVASAGRTLAEVVPLDDTLMVEAKVRPADIAFILPELPAKVRITAFDSGLYGAMEAVVERISPDSQTDERTGTVYYIIYVRTRENSIKTPQGDLSILPGMVAEVDVITGNRTVLDYLLQPITRGLQTALRER